MNRIKLLLASLVALAFAAGCSPSAGTVTLKLTDAPGDFKKAVVTIDSIYLTGTADEKAGEAGKAGEVVLLSEPHTVDLLTLANSTADLVKDAVVPAGTYRELRFVISGGYVEVEQADGSTKIFASSPTYAGLPEGAQVAGPLQMPSYAASGLKVKLTEDVEISGEQKVLLVDFSVAESFGHNAATGKWVMGPVIKAGEMTFSGSVLATLVKADNASFPAGKGMTDLVAVLSHPAVDVNGAAITAEEKLALTDENSDGTFEAHFQFLFPGDYSLTFEPAADGNGINGVTTNPGTPASVTVVSGQDQTQAFTLTAVE